MFSSFPFLMTLITVTSTKPVKNKCASYNFLIIDKFSKQLLNIIYKKYIYIIFDKQFSFFNTSTTCSAFYLFIFAIYAEHRMKV